MLAGRKTVGTIDGAIAFAGVKPTPEFLRRYTGYVEQFGACAPHNSPLPLSCSVAFAAGDVQRCAFGLPLCVLLHRIEDAFQCGLALWMLFDMRKS